MSRFCLAPRAPYSSLLKQPKESKKRKPVKSARDRDDKHLAAVRRCPCIACDTDPARVAAHVRMSAPGKPVTGIGVKPDDRYTLPLCDDCHTRQPDAQHNVGEVKFWAALGLDPLAICAKLYAASPDVPKMRDFIFAAREGRK